MEIEQLQQSALSVIGNILSDSDNDPPLALSAAKFILTNFRIETKKQVALYDMSRLSQEETPIFMGMLDKISIKQKPSPNRDSQLSLL